MWYAVTANPVQRSNREKRKEFSAFSSEVVMSADTLEELQQKIRESKKVYPEQTLRYLAAGIKLVEARNAAEAKRKSKTISFYFRETGQYGFF